MLSGYVITLAEAGITVYTTDINHVFLGLSAIFALSAAVYFFLRK